MKTIQVIAPIASLIAMMVIHSGCQSSAGHTPGSTAPSPPSKVLYMDPLVTKSVVSTGLHVAELPDGRLEVMANLKNLLNKRIQVEVQCVFKDLQGFSTGDETPWRTLILTENGEETLRFVSLNNLARDYAIRVREAH
jgi:hypothetical protein